MLDLGNLQSKSPFIFGQHVKKMIAFTGAWSHAYTLSILTVF